MSDELVAGNEPGSAPNVRRRQLGAAVLAALAGGLGTATTAQALPRSAAGQLDAASRILAPYGVIVVGDTVGSHDRVGFEIAALPTTEYSQVVGARNRQGAIEPWWTTSVLGEDAVATHFHPGEIIPCIRTTIEHNELALHELFDSDQGGIVPCFVVESAMLPGGHFGTIKATHFHDGAIVPCVRTTIEGHSLATHEVFDTTEGDIVPCVKVATEMLDGGAIGDVEIKIDPDLTSFRLVVGDSAYRLVGGALVPETTPR